MRLRLLASVLMLLCSWVLWEKSIFFRDGTGFKSIEAVSEAKSLSECRAAFPNAITQREKGLKKVWKEPEYTTASHDQGAGFTLQKDGHEVQEYFFYCLPSTVDPYQHPF